MELGRLVYPKSNFNQLNEGADEETHPLTKIAKSPTNKQEHLPLALSEKISSLTLEWDTQELRQRVAKLYSEIQANEPMKPAEDFLDATAQITGLFLHNFVTLRRCVKEVQKRNPGFSPKSQLDIGFGPATGVLAVNEVWPEIEYKKAVIYGNYEMKNKAKMMVDGINNVVFTDALPTKTSPQTFDLITCTNQLYKKPQNGYTSYIEQLSRELAELLNPGGIILFLENGGPLGFESVVSMRSALLGYPVDPVNEESTSKHETKHTFSVVGPCTHAQKCPLSFGLENRMLAKNPGKFNWCSFSQNIQRPKYTLELKKGQYLSQEWQKGQQKGAGGSVLRGNGRSGGLNYETANFSWIALKKEPTDASSNDTASVEWPRVLRDPLKRHKHVLMEVCTNGAIEQWTIPRSLGQQVYNDARRISAMDLWPFSAKTKQQRGGLPDTLWAKLKEVNTVNTEFKPTKRRTKLIHRKADRLSQPTLKTELEETELDS